MGSSVSGVLSAMRIVNLTMAGCMVALAVGQIIQSDSAFSVMADALSVIYTMYEALLAEAVAVAARVLIGWVLLQLLRVDSGGLRAPHGLH
jgi:hypothetical protein